MIVASRTRPQLSFLPQLGVQRRVSHITKRELRLTDDEVRALVRELRGHEPSHKEARALQEACEGWPVAVVLTSLAGEISVKLEIDDYFRRVVVNSLTPNLWEFLLGTSVLNEMTGEHCDSLLGRADSGSILEDLYKRNLLIEKLEARPPIYRYHRLFRQFLYSEAERVSPTALRRLHRRAGEAYLSRSDAIAAARHFLAAAEFEAAARAVAAASAKELTEGRGSVAELIDCIPNEVVERYPRILLTRARVHYQLNELDLVVAKASKALALFQQTGDREAAAEAELLQATALKHRGEIPLALERCQNVLKLLKGRDSPTVLAEALLQTGICQGLQGRLLEGNKLLKRARTLFVRIGNLEREAIASEALGTGHALLGSDDQALAYYERAREAWTRLGYDLALSRILLNIGCTYLIRGDYGSACEALEGTILRLKSSPDTHLEAMVWVNLGELKRDVQLYDEALRCYQIGQEKARECLDSWLSVYAAIGRASVLRLRHQYEPAHQLLKDLVPPAEEIGDLAHGLVLLSLASVALQSGRESDARAQIELAIGLLRAKQPSVEMARAQFWRARLAYQTGRPREVQEALAEVARCLGPSSALPLADLRGSQGLLKHAAASDVEAQLCIRLLRAVRTKYDHLAGRGGVVPGRRRQQTAPLALTLQSLGQGAVRIDDTRIAALTWRSEKAKELLFLLAWRGRPMRRLEIESELWPEFSEARAHTNFRVTVFRAREATFPEAITFSSGVYELNRRVRVDFDAKEFVRLSRAARRSPPGSSERLLLLQTAWSLYGGPFLDGIYSEWCVSVRNDLESWYVSALLEIADNHQRAGEHAQAIAWYEQATKIDPLSESAYEGLITATVARGDILTARSYYELYRSRVRAELGAEPPDHFRYLIPH